MVLRRFLAGKVPTDVAFLRHLLGFVMRRAASEASHPGLAGNDRSKTGRKRRNHTGDSSMEVASSIRKKLPDISVQSVDS